MFADNTNLFDAVENIRTSIELQKISQEFISSKLSLTVTKTKHSLNTKQEK